MEESTRKVISFVKLREFMRNPSLSFGEKCVFIDLILYAGVDGEAFPSQETLAEDMGRTSRHIRNILKSLKSKNWIDWEKQGYSQSNRYYINEELYFLNDVNDRKSTSSDSGTAFPLQTRTPFPANEYQERNQLKESYKYVPCDQKGCDKGYIINKETNTARVCGCIQGWIRKLNDGTTPIT